MGIFNISVLLIVFCLTDFNFISFAEAEESISDRIRPQDIEVLTLNASKKTHGRRVPPVGQLKRVGGNAGFPASIPQVVQCYNRGWDGKEVQWECKADLEFGYKFGKVTVTCENYDCAGGQYVSRNSCGLEYELDDTVVFTYITRLMRVMKYMFICISSFLITTLFLHLDIIIKHYSSITDNCPILPTTRCGPSVSNQKVSDRLEIHVSKTASQTNNKIHGIKTASNTISLV